MSQRHLKLHRHVLFIDTGWGIPWYNQRKDTMGRVWGFHILKGGFKTGSCDSLYVIAVVGLSRERDRKQGNDRETHGGGKCLKKVMEDG